MRGHLIWKLPCSSTCTCTAHCSPTVQRCSYKVPYPNVYADPAKNEQADAFNRVQVGHLQWCWLVLLLLFIYQVQPGSPDACSSSYEAV